MAPKDDDTRSLVSMQELDPSPVSEDPDLERGEYFPENAEDKSSQPGLAGSGFFGQKLGLRGHSWDSWCMDGPNAYEVQRSVTD